MNEDRIKIAQQIADKQIQICSRPSFRGYIDKVLFRLLKENDMTLKEFYECFKDVKV